MQTAAETLGILVAGLLPATIAFLLIAGTHNRDDDLPARLERLIPAMVVGGVIYLLFVVGMIWAW